jgi:hypothetical protein
VADDVDTLIAELQAIVDVDATAALRLLNRRHRQAVARAQTYFTPVSLDGDGDPGLRRGRRRSTARSWRSGNAFTWPAGSGRSGTRAAARTTGTRISRGWLAWEGNGLFVPIGTGVVR